MYALVTGTLPFDDDNVRRLLQKVKTGVFTIPDFVPADAADLIRRMLVVNPSKRMTIAQIEQHAWFKKRPFTWKTNNNGPLVAPPSIESLAPMQVSEHDYDILENLSLLGLGSHEELLAALAATEPNYEKARSFAVGQTLIT